MNMKKQTPRRLLSVLLLLALLTAPAVRPATAAEQEISGLSLTMTTPGQAADTENIPPGPVPLAAPKTAGAPFSPLIMAGLSAVGAASVIAVVILRKASKLE